jgi:hypothetical protein
VKPRRVNVDQMRRYRGRSSERYVYSREEHRGLLEQMQRRVNELCAEDGLPPAWPHLIAGSAVSAGDVVMPGRVGRVYPWRAGE